jgi:hypothetical protein
MLVGILWVAVGVGIAGWGGRCRLGCMWVVLIGGSFGRRRLRLLRQSNCQGAGVSCGL